MANFEVFFIYNDCIFMDSCWIASGLYVKTSIEFMLSTFMHKLSLFSLFFYFMFLFIV